MAEAANRSRQDQIAWERARRARLAIPTIVGGVLLLASGITALAVLRNAPTTGLVDGLGNVLNPSANPNRSPRTAEVIYVSHHAFGLILASVMSALALVALVLATSFLFDAVRFRRPETMTAARQLVLYGGLVVAVLGVLSQVVTAIDTHHFATGHDFSNRAADHAYPPINGSSASSSDTLRSVAGFVGLAAELALAVGLIVVSLNAMRTGLLTRLMGVLGIIVGVLFVLPLGLPLPIIPAFWVAALGVLYLGRWPNGDPPAWAAGEAVPWLPPAEARAQRDAAAGRPARGRQAAPAAAGRAAADAPPEPAAPAQTASRKRKRKGRGRR